MGSDDPAAKTAGEGAFAGAKLGRARGGGGGALGDAAIGGACGYAHFNRLRSRRHAWRRLGWRCAWRRHAR